MSAFKFTSALGSSAMLGLLCVAPAIAGPLTISFGQLNGTGDAAIGDAAFALDGSGLTSARLSDPSHGSFQPGFFVETFDLATAAPIAGLPAFESAANGGSLDDLGTSVSVSGTNSRGLEYSATVSEGQGCSINAFGGPAISSTGGGFAVQKGSTSGVAATPAGDSTCFGFGPQPGSQSSSATVKIDYGSVLISGDAINYLGIYYGSIDRYNELRFYDAQDVLLRTLTGGELIDEFQATPGNQTSPLSNLYVNLEFAPSLAFTSFELVTTGRAIEVDNITLGLASREVPAPATFALFGLGLVSLSLKRRKNA